MNKKITRPCDLKFELFCSTEAVVNHVKEDRLEAIRNPGFPVTADNAELIELYGDAIAQAKRVLGGSWHMRSEHLLERVSSAEAVAAYVVHVAITRDNVKEFASLWKFSDQELVFTVEFQDVGGTPIKRQASLLNGKLMLLKSEEDRGV